MKQQTVDVLDRATDVIDEIDRLDRQFQFTYKSEAYLALEENPFLPAEDRINQNIDVHPNGKYWKMRYDIAKETGNEDAVQECLARTSTNIPRKMISLFDDSDNCEVCIFEAMDDEERAEFDLDAIYQILSRPHFVSPGPNYWLRNPPPLAEDEDFRL